MVYGVFGILYKYNEIGWVMVIKISVCFLIVILIWEILGVFDLVWSLFSFFFGNCLFVCFIFKFVIYVVFLVLISDINEGYTDFLKL